MFPISDSINSKSFPFFNILLIIITSYIFIQQLLAPSFEGFIAQYALIPSHVNFSDISTLTPFVTAIFLHGGWLHILSNMWFLWVFGDDVEGYLGHLTYLFVYFITGIFGNLLQYFFIQHSPIPTLGASGAVAGILGAYYILFPHSKVKTLLFLPFFFFLTLVNIPAPYWLGLWFLLQLISGAFSLTASVVGGGVAFWAHIGGFIAGMLFAKLFRKEDKGYIEGEFYDA